MDPRTVPKAVGEPSTRIRPPTHQRVSEHRGLSAAAVSRPSPRSRVQPARPCARASAESSSAGDASSRRSPRGPAVARSFGRTGWGSREALVGDVRVVLDGTEWLDPEDPSSGAPLAGGRQVDVFGLAPRAVVRAPTRRPPDSTTTGRHVTPQLNHPTRRSEAKPR